MSGSNRCKTSKQSGVVVVQSRSTERGSHERMCPCRSRKRSLRISWTFLRSAFQSAQESGFSMCLCGWLFSRNACPRRADRRLHEQQVVNDILERIMDIPQRRIQQQVVSARHGRYRRRLAGGLQELLHRTVEEMVGISDPEADVKQVKITVAPSWRLAKSTRPHTRTSSCSSTNGQTEDREVAQKFFAAAQHT